MFRSDTKQLRSVILDISRKNIFIILLKENWTIIVASLYTGINLVTMYGRSRKDY